jgi:hypothetical protein
MYTLYTYDSLQRLFVDDLQELKRLKQRGWLVWPMDRIVKEEHVGRCCYLAEELLSGEELYALKRVLDLDEQQWRGYKSKITK